MIAEGLRILESPEGVTLEYDGYDGRMIKQADVNLLAYPLGVVTDSERILNDLEYYESRIDMINGPAMTFSIFAIQYARLGLRKKAMEMFHRAYQPNIRSPFGVFAETPTSNNPYFMTGAGGLLQAVIFGFGGLEITDDGVVQRESVLPQGWRSLTIKGVGPEKKIFTINNR
jgi:trehalose/maltose hydrolase-like predicted phosphorylase